MIALKRLRYVPAVALALLGLAWAGQAQATSMTYAVTVDTSSLFGTTGTLDFQYNPSGVGPDVLTATVTNFTPAAGLQAGTFATTPGSDVTGSLPGPLTFKDDTGLNEASQNFTFGNQLTFDVTFSGNLANPNPGAEFSFTAYDQNGDPALFASGGSGFSALIIDNNSDGTQTVVTSSQTTATPQNGVAASPEPSSIVLLCGCMVGVGGCCLLRMRRLKTAPCA